MGTVCGSGGGAGMAGVAPAMGRSRPEAPPGWKGGRKAGEAASVADASEPSADLMPITHLDRLARHRRAPASTLELARRFHPRLIRPFGTHGSRLARWQVWHDDHASPWTMRHG